MSDEIKIDKGIPIDRSRQKKKYPFAKMEVGDSFAIKGKGTASILSTAKSWKKHNHKADWEFCARFYRKEEMVRIWRIK